MEQTSNLYDHLIIMNGQKTICADSMVKMMMDSEWMAMEKA